MTNDHMRAPNPLRPGQIASLKKRRQLYLASLMLAILPIGTSCFLSLLTDVVLPQIAFYAMGAVFLPHLAIKLLLWKCPACKQGLGNDPRDKYCKNCGVRLIYEGD